MAFPQVVALLITKLPEVWGFDSIPSTSMVIHQEQK